MGGVLVGFGHGGLERLEKQGEALLAGTGRPEASSRAAKRRKMERSQAMEESGPKPPRWVR